MKKITLLFIFLFLYHLTIFGQIIIPAKLTYTVSDFTSNTLTREDINELSNEVQRIYDSTGIELAIVILESSFGESLESFSLRMANQWKVGNEKKSNGILILVLKNDRKVRIEIGKGLSNVVTNQEAERIISHSMIPDFKLNEYGSGLKKGLSSLEKVLIKNADLMKTDYSKYTLLWLFVPWFFMIELLKRLLSYKWLTKILGFVGYVLIGMFVVDIGVSIGFAFILFLISFLLIKYPKNRLVFKKTESSQFQAGRLVYSIGFLGISMISIPQNNYFLGNGTGSGLGDYSGGSFGGSGGDFGGGGDSFGGDGGSGSW